MGALTEELWPSGVDEAADKPSFVLTASEAARVVVAVDAWLLAYPWLRRAPRGDGHPVLVLPGLMAGDASTLALRHILRRLNYRPYKWHLGRNVGPTPAVRAELPAAIERIARRNRSTVSLVGWSMGGIYARELAHRNPDSVRQVITLASPYRIRHAGQSRADSAFTRYSHLHVWEGGREQVSGTIRRPLTVPSTSIYSRLDGIVPWQHCIEPVGAQAENIRVRSSHLGIGFDPHVLWAVVDRLSQAEGQWSPFDPPRLLTPFFPPPDHPQEQALDVR